MKNRKIPFGYRYENGRVAIQQSEAEVLNRIYDAYCAGSSLLTIAGELNNQDVEYMPGVTGWNKARLKRLIEDERYLGNDTYPALIEHDVFAQVQAIKEKKSTQTMVDRNAPVFQITVPVICPICGRAMKRRNDCRCTQAHRWVCTNPECGILIPKDDSELLSSITELLNMLITQPEMIEIPEDITEEPSLESRKIKNGIAKMMDEIRIDRDAVRQQILAYVAQRYNDLDSRRYMIRRLKAEFERAEPLTEFSAQLFGNAVREIQLHSDTTVSIVLINGQIIGKEQP